MNVPRTSLSHQLSQEDVPAPAGSTNRKRRKTRNGDVSGQSQAQSTHDPQPSTHVSTDPPRRRKDNLERAKPLIDFQVTIGQKISDLEEAGAVAIPWITTNPRPSQTKLHPPSLGLDLLKSGTNVVPFLDDDKVLYGWLASNAVLPCLKQFQQEVLNNPELRKDLTALLAEDEAPFVKTIEHLGGAAYHYADMIDRKRVPTFKHSAAILGCAKYIRRLRRSAMAHFMHFVLDSGSSHFEDFLYFHCARTILTVHLDLERDADGFCGIMLQSPYAEPMVADARLEWDKLLVLPGGGDNTAHSVTTVQAASIAHTEARKGNATGSKMSAFDADMQRWRLEKEFLDATVQNPRILTQPPSENGQTEFADSSKADYPVRECVQECRPEEGLHTDNCHAVHFVALKKHINYTQPSREAIVPDQEQFDPSENFTFGRRRPIPPHSVTKVFNFNNLIDPFTEEETLTAYKRIREVLKAISDDTIDYHCKVVVWPTASISITATRCRSISK
jgi:hypothetical protein